MAKITHEQNVKLKDVVTKFIERCLKEQPRYDDGSGPAKLTIEIGCDGSKTDDDDHIFSIRAETTFSEDI